VRLSGKEVAGLAARVLVAALVPPGATGGASEAIEFLELTEGAALARLDAQKQALTEVDWRIPVVTFEEGDVACVDGQDVPAHFFGAALADWLASIALEHGAGALHVADVGSIGLLAASTYFLAGQGLSSAVLATDADGRPFFRLALAGQDWLLLQWPDGEAPVVLLEAMATLSADRSGTLRRIIAGCRALAKEPAKFADRREAPDLERGNAIMVAFDDKIEPRALPALAGQAAAAGLKAISGADYSALKTRILAEGWPLDRPLWERLMAFADKSLIPTSERSRLGSG